MGGGTSFTRFLENIGLIQAEKQRLDFEVTDSGNCKRLYDCRASARAFRHEVLSRNIQPSYYYRMSDIESRIRAVLEDHGRLAKNAAALDVNDDLQQAGMTSHASVNVMLGLEGEFDIEFPDHMLSRTVFSSIASIQAAVQQLLT
jgi:acyl carrier protein